MKRRYKSLPPVIRWLVIVFWVLIWQLCSYLVPYKFLFASPVQVMAAFGQLCFSADFWLTTASSFWKISAGFFLALLTGCLLAAFSYRFVIVRELLMPLIRLIKAIPVASFIILVILWFNSSSLSTIISFSMVLPVIYINILQGLDSYDEKMLEMAYVFRLSLVRRIRYLYIPALMPYFVTACSLGLGFCWKSGVAAEVIGQPAHSIGGEIYMTKLNLLTPELFVWTIVIILISASFEKLIMFFLHKLEKKISHLPRQGQE